MNVCACGKKILPSWKTCNECDNEDSSKWVLVPKTFDAENLKERIAMVEKRERELEQKLKLVPDRRGDGCIACHLLTKRIEDLESENELLKQQISDYLLAVRHI